MPCAHRIESITSTEPAGLAELPLYHHRRLEDWLVSCLEDRDPDEDDLPAFDVDTWLSTAGGSQSAAPRRRGKPQRIARNWSRFRVLRYRSTAVVSLLDKLLIKDEVVTDLGNELQDLALSGFHRLVLDFRNVERMSSQIVAAIARLHKRCRAVAFGHLKLAGLSPQLAEVFALAGLADTVSLFPDVKTALATAWPSPEGPHPLPLSILEALRQNDPRPATAMPPTLPELKEKRELSERSSLLLVVASGRYSGRVIRLGVPLLKIGRGASCRLRCPSSLVSREHAAVEMHEGTTILKDLGSTNGTLVNGELIPAHQPRQLQVGDRITIGPLALVVAATGEETDPGSVDDLVVTWVEPEIKTEEPAFETITCPPSEAPGHPRLRVEKIQGVTVLTPQFSEMNDKAGAELLREALENLAAEGSPRVVVNLDYVRQFSSRALGMLIAHHLRFERAGGGLRLCLVHDRVLSILENLRVTMLLPIFHTLDDAVLNGWNISE